MLVVYYSCGLRRNEGVQLTIDDVNLDTKLLHVRKGKNYKERYVPFNKANARYLQDYIHEYRPQLIKTKKESRLFINTTGKPLSGGTLYTRLKLLQQQSSDATLQQKNIGLHTLRHSIATHLLQNGMPLEKIARFLGHASLDTTQLYTQLLEKETQHHEHI
jgi:integrase/recombinase XerD